jgi:hypothetical protein
VALECRSAQQYNSLNSAGATPVATLFYGLPIRRARSSGGHCFGCISDAICYGGARTRRRADVGWFRIARILVGAVFVYDGAVESGQFEFIRQSIGRASDDRAPRFQQRYEEFARPASLENVLDSGACGLPFLDF